MSKKKTEAGPVTIESGTDLYRCLLPVHHDNSPYAVGAEIELTPTQAAPLLAAQAIALSE